MWPAPRRVRRTLLSRSERAAYEQTIAHLRDEILWLRAFVRPESTVSYSRPPAVKATETEVLHDAWESYYAEQAQGPDLAPKKVVSDDEEAIQEMLADDQIDLAEAEALLEALGSQNTTIEFAS